MSATTWRSGTLQWINNCSSWFQPAAKCSLSVHNANHPQNDVDVTYSTLYLLLSYCPLLASIIGCHTFICSRCFSFTLLFAYRNSRMTDGIRSPIKGPLFSRGFEPWILQWKSVQYFGIRSTWWYQSGDPSSCGLNHDTAAPHSPCINILTQGAAIFPSLILLLCPSSRAVPSFFCARGKSKNLCHLPRKRWGHGKREVHSQREGALIRGGLAALYLGGNPVKWVRYGL